MRRSVLFTLPFTAILCGCGTNGSLLHPQFLTKPDLSTKSNQELSLKTPLLVTVVDEQAQERGNDYSGTLMSEIKKAYPKAATTATAKPTDARQAFVEIRIHKLGAFLCSGTSMSMYGTVQAPGGAIADWQSVLVTANDTEGPVSAIKYVNLNNWCGVVNIDVTVRDDRPGRIAAFHFPILAQRLHKDDLGALAAYAVAGEAWDNASERLMRFIDASVRKLIAEERESG